MALRGIPAQYTNDDAVIPSRAALKILAAAGRSEGRSPIKRYASLALAGAQESGDDSAQAAAELLATIAGRKESMEPEQSRLRSLFSRMDNLYFTESISDPGGADHWPEGRKPGRAHVSDNVYHVYVDIPASLQAVPPIENVVGDDSTDDEREAAARVERLYFGWKDEDEFELKTHQACTVKALYGHTFAKVYWDTQEKRPTVTIIERPEQFYAGWGSSNYDRLDWGLYCYGLSEDAIEIDFGLKVGAYDDGANHFFPYVLAGDHSDPLHTISTTPEYKRNIPEMELVEVYDYWYKRPKGRGKFDVWNAIYIGNRLVEHAAHPEFDDIPYVPLPNTYIPGSPYGRPEIYDVEQMIREKDERLSAAAQMIESITNGQMWQLLGPDAPDDVPANAIPKANKVAAPGPGNKLESIQPFVPQFAIEDYLKRIDEEIEGITGLNPLLLGRVVPEAIGSSRAVNALIATYEARIRIKRELLYRWRKRVWTVAAKAWERKSRDVRDIIDGRYRIDVKAPELTPRDELEVANMARNLVDGHIWSLERAMDRTGVEDPSDEKALIRTEQTDPTINPGPVNAQVTLMSTFAALQAQGVELPSAEQAANATRQARPSGKGSPTLNAPENQVQTPPENLPANAEAGGLLSQTMVSGGESSGRVLTETKL